MTLLTDITADLSSIFYDATTGFAESVTGPSGAILGIFDNEYQALDPDGRVQLTGSTPVLRTVDADALAVGNAVTIRTVGYTVVEVMPTSFGETIHRLRET